MAGKGAGGRGAWIDRGWHRYGQRGHAVAVELVNINPSVGIRFDDKHSVGAGVQIIGVQTARFPAMVNVVKGTAHPQGSSTIAEGIAVGVPGAITRRAPELGEDTEAVLSRLQP